MFRMVFYSKTKDFIDNFVPNFIKDLFKLNTSETIVALEYPQLPLYNDINNKENDADKNNKLKYDNSNNAWICSDAIISLLIIFAPQDVKNAIWKVNFDENEACSNVPENMKRRINLPLDYIRFGSASISDFETLQLRVPHLIEEIIFKPILLSKL